MKSAMSAIESRKGQANITNKTYVRKCRCLARTGEDFEVSLNSDVGDVGDVGESDEATNKTNITNKNNEEDNEND